MLINVNEYIIPQGFIFEYIPPDVNLESKWLDVRVEYLKTSNGIKQAIRQHYKRTDTPTFGYKRFKEFLQRAEDSLNECIVIRKGKGIWVDTWQGIFDSCSDDTGSLREVGSGLETSVFPSLLLKTSC